MNADGTDDETSNRTDHETSNRTDHRTDDETSNRTDHRTDDETSNRTDHRTDDETSNRTDHETSNRTDHRTDDETHDQRDDRTDDGTHDQRDDRTGDQRHTDPTPSGPLPRLLADTLSIGAPYRLAVAGDYAVLAHGLVAKAGGAALEVATESPEPMEAIAATLRSGLEDRGHRVRPPQTTPLAARLLVTDPATDAEHPPDTVLDIVKETLWRPPVDTALGPALSLEDVTGTKVRALADRGLARDLVAVHAAADRWSFPELEELGRRHALDAFDLADLQSRLEGMEWIADRDFTDFGLDEQAVTALRQWAQSWADDIAERLLEEKAMEPPPDE